MPDLLLTYDFPPMGGGIARWMEALARGFPPGGLTVSTGAMPGSDAVDRGLPTPVDRVAVQASHLRTLPGLLLWSRRVTRLARTERPDFVWCGQLRPAAYPAKWVRERLRVPYGILVHGGDLLALQHRVHRSAAKRGIARSLIGSAACMVAASRWTRDLCLQVLGEVGLHPFDGFVHLVPLGTDPAIYRPGLATDDVRARYGLGPGRWMITVARLVPHKGVDTTLSALAALADEFPDLRYAVVGSGPHQPDLQALAEDLRLGERVRFLDGVSDADLPAVYNVAELYVGVSRRVGHDVEGFGISLLEASASGLPVVAGTSGGMADAVRDGDTGVLVNGEHPDEVAGAIRLLLQDRDRARVLGAGGRRAVESYFNWDRVVRDLRAISAATPRPSPAAPRP